MDNEKNLQDPENEKDIKSLIQKHGYGNTSSRRGTKSIKGTSLSKLRAKRGARVYFKEQDNIVEV